MAIKLFLPTGIVGLCDYSTKTITLVEQRALELPESELERLTDLGEYCIKIAQTLSSRSVKEEMQKLGLKNLGDREYPTYSTDAHWFFGIIGGLEVYGTQFCDGPRYAFVVDRGDEVFGYHCSEIGQFGVENPAIRTYTKGPWEAKISELYQKARNMLDRNILTLEDSCFY